MVERRKEGKKGPLSDAVTPHVAAWIRHLCIVYLCLQDLWVCQIIHAQAGLTSAHAA